MKADPFLAYTYLQIAASMEESKKPRRDAAAKFLNADEIKKADAIAAEWKKGMPLPTH